MWESRDAYRVWWRNLRERVHLGDLGVDGRIILKCIWGGGWTALIWFMMGGRAHCCEQGNEPSGCIKYREFHYVRKR